MNMPPNADIPARSHELVSRWSTVRSDAPALSDTTRHLSYRQLHDTIERAVAWLRDHGVRSGDRVMIVAENSVAPAVLMFAAQKIEAWPAIVNARIPAREIEAMRECADARLCLYAIDHSPAAEAHAATDTAGLIDDEAIGRIVLGTINPDCNPEPVHADHRRQVALMIFTSGTTGTPKAVMLSHFGLMNMGRILTGTRHTTAGDRYSGAAPLSHIIGQANLMNILWAGASLDLMPRVEVSRLAEGIASGHMTHLSFVPTVYARLLDHIERTGIDLSGQRLRYISSGGAPLDPELKRRIERTFGMPMVNGYGMTECAPASRSRHDLYGGEPGNIGKPEPGIEARIVGSDGIDIAADGVGELWLRSDSVMMGYYRNPQATAEVLRPDGWFRTGDLARWLDDGEIAIVGRAKEMIIRSGFNVYPAEVEAALNTLPGVLQSGVVGRPVAEGNEEVIAFVEPQPGVQLDEQELIEQLRELIAPYKRPARILVMEALPLGSTGKIWKKRLAELAAAL
jgi:long-chain acyl-CoA synthetase